MHGKAVFHNFLHVVHPLSNQTEHDRAMLHFLERSLKMEWFKFHTIWSEGVRELSDAEERRFLKAVCDYIDYNETQALSGNERMLFSMALKQMKQDAERNAKISSARAEAGRIGGLSKSKQLQAIDSKCKQNEANEANAYKNKELRIKNQEKDKDNICAETRTSAPNSAKMTPDDSDFWKFAKENAELAETFYRTTGIIPVKSQFGRWVKDLRDIAEAGISPEQLQKTITYMQSEGIQLSAPGSCLKTAQWLKSRGSVPVKKSPVPQRQYSFAEVYEMQERGEL